MKRALIFICVLISFASYGQVKQEYNQYGGLWKRLSLRWNGGFQLPRSAVSTKDLNVVTLDTAQLYYNPTDSSLYYFTGFQAIKVATGPGIDTSNKWVNWIQKVSDSIIFWIGGTRYAIKDSTGGTPYRFGKSGEDVTPAENRSVDFTGTYNLSLNNIPSYQVIIDSSSSSAAYALIFGNKFNNNLAIGSGYRASSTPAAFFRSSINSGNPYASIGVSPDNNFSNETKFTAYSDSLSAWLARGSKYKVHNLPSGVGTKALRYDPSNGEITYADTTASGGGSSMRFGYPSEDVTAAEDRTFNFKEDYSLRFDSLNLFYAGFHSLSQINFYNYNTGVNRLDLSPTGSQIQSPDGADNIAITNDRVWFTINTGDSLGSTVLPYSPSSRLVPLVQDTVTGRLYRQTISGGSSFGDNVGSGYRIFKPGTRDFKTLHFDYGGTFDSSSHTDEITAKIDTSFGGLTTRALTKKIIDSLQAAGWGAQTVQYEPWYNMYLDRTSSTSGSWSKGVSGTGASCGEVPADIFDGWAFQQTMNTGTTNSGLAFHYTSAAGDYAPIAISNSYRYNYGVKARIEDLSDGTDTYSFYTGFGDANNGISNVVDGIFFRYAYTDSSGKWIACTKSNSTTTETATDITVAADTDYELEISVIGGSAYFYINKVLKATISTNIPTGTTRITSLINVIKKSAGTNQRKIYIEWMAFGKRKN